MAGLATDDAENFFLNHLFNKQAAPQPTNLYLGAFLADPGEAGALTSEVTAGSNYARITLSVLMSAASVGSIPNATEVAFNVASNVWGTILWLAFIATGVLATGRMWLRSSMTSVVYLDAGKQLKFAASNLVMSCD